MSLVVLMFFGGYQIARNVGSVDFVREFSIQSAARCQKLRGVHSPGKLGDRLTSHGAAASLPSHTPLLLSTLTNQ